MSTKLVRHALRQRYADWMKVRATDIGPTPSYEYQLLAGAATEHLVSLLDALDAADTEIERLRAALDDARRPKPKKHSREWWVRALNDTLESPR